jgi:hypothetical protein
MNKKTFFIIIVAITIVLFAILIVNQYVMSLGDLLGYIYYIVIAAGIIAAVWLLVGKRGKSLVPPQAEADK